MMAPVLTDADLRIASKNSLGLNPRSPNSSPSIVNSLVSWFPVAWFGTRLAGVAQPSRLSTGPALHPRVFQPVEHGVMRDAKRLSDLSAAVAQPVGRRAVEERRALDLVVRDVTQLATLLCSLATTASDTRLSTEVAVDRALVDIKQLC